MLQRRMRLRLHRRNDGLMPKKVPMRTCIGCGECKEKKSMIRIVRTAEGRILADPGGRMNGRGAYLCRNAECLEKAFRRKALGRALRCEVKKDEYEALRAQLEEQEAPE